MHYTEGEVIDWLFKLGGMEERRMDEEVFETGSRKLLRTDRTSNIKDRIFAMKQILGTYIIEQ